MSKKTKKIVILTEVELRKTISRLTSEIIEKVKKLDNLLMVGIPTRGIELTEVLKKELFFRTGLRVRKGTIDPTFYRDDQNRVGTRLIQAADIPTPIEKQEILLIDDVIYTGRTIRAAMDALYSWGRPQRVMLLVMVDRGHRELPIQPDFCGKKVPTSKIESISLRLKNVYNEEGVFLEYLRFQKIFPKLNSPKNSSLTSKHLTNKSAFFVILKKSFKVSSPM